jgi:hypothetical protein
MKFYSSMRISASVLVCWLNSAEWESAENSILNLISPSLGRPSFGVTIFSVLYVNTFVWPSLTMTWPFS